MSDFAYVRESMYITHAHTHAHTQKLWKKRCVSREAKEEMYEGIAESSLLYGFEVWGLNVHERKRLKTVQMNC